MLVGEIWLPDADRFARYLRPDELHTAFNFDFLACPWDAAARCALDRRDPGRARAGRRAGDLGAVQPRRHPAGHPLRPRGHLVRLRGQARRHPDRPRARPPPGARRRPAGDGAARARSTSTRARSSGCPRSRTSRTTGCRTRCTSARADVDPGRDGCRVPLPWAGVRRRRTASAVERRRRLAAPAGGLGRAHRRGQAERRRVDAVALPRRPAAPPRRPVDRRRRAAPGSTARSGRSSSPAASDFVCLVNFGRPVNSRPGRRPHSSNDSRSLLAGSHGWLDQTELTSPTRSAGRLTSAQSVGTSTGQREGMTMKTTAHGR